MKEIGLSFKEKREEGGLSVSEVAEDLKVDVSDIEFLESGDKNHFSDVYFLKDLIAEYAKYLGLDSAKFLDDFNEYMFSATSRISLDDIEKAKEEFGNKQGNRVVSPYTKRSSNRKKITLIFICALLFLLVVFFIVFFAMKNLYVSSENDDISSNVSYIGGGE